MAQAHALLKRFRAVCPRIVTLRGITWRAERRERREEPARLELPEERPAPPAYSAARAVERKEGSAARWDWPALLFVPAAGRKPAGAFPMSAMSATCW